MSMNNLVYNDLRKLLKHAAAEKWDANSYRDICEHLKIAKVYYDMNLDDENKYRDPRTGAFIVAQLEKDNKIVLYDSREEGDLRLVYPYYNDGQEYVHVYIEFRRGVEDEDIDHELYQFMADTIYLLASRRNMSVMLDYSEIVDQMTGIPNVHAFHREYDRITSMIPPHIFLVLHINIRNLRYINETAGVKCGDEAIIRYARTIVRFVGENEYVCRIGSDNYAMLLRRDHLEEVLDRLKCVVLRNLENAPGRDFEILSWIGISEMEENSNKSVIVRLNEASMAADAAKQRLKKSVVYYNDALARVVNMGRDIIEMFHPAMRNNEFIPFFQPKIDMRTGELIGLEALCRWKHGGTIIYPNQFIPMLDEEGTITELDMAIFNAVCQMIHKWKGMGIKVPRVSCNFSRKNLFVQDIENKIMRVIEGNGICADDIEIEITESSKEAEYTRLIEFVRILKDHGLHISIDDFGTGYSSLSLIHNIEADVIKIDKSFVDSLPGDKKSRVLIESIINIASRLNMTTVAEGVETDEQGKCLIELGCNIAQGFYYSRPISFTDITRVIEHPEFKPVGKE